jgi:replicative DNA helicase
VNDFQERSAPSDHVAEQSVLGGMLLSKTAIDEVTGILTGPDFYRPAHEAVFEAIVDLRERNVPADVVTVAELLAKSGDLERCGGRMYLHTLISHVPTAANAGYYADIVRKYSALRLLVATGVRLAGMGNNSDTDLADVPELLGVAIRDLTAVLNATPGTTVPTIGDLFIDTLDGIEHPPANRHVPTGIHDLDAVLGGGLNPGQLALIAARPAVGKSVMGFGLARKAAIGAGIPTLFVTLEMSADDIMRRLISAEAAVNLHHLQSNQLDERDWGLISRITERVLAAPLHIDNTPGISAAQLRNTIRTLRRTTGVGLVIVDYLQLMTPPKAENREQRIAALSRDLKSMAQEFQVPIVALCQINRESEKRSDKRPAMSDLRESGSLEQEADVIVLMHREDAYERETPRAGECDLILAKNRSGPTATITVAFQGHYARVVDMATPDWSPHSALNHAA